MENGQPVMCAECRTHFFWAGKGRKAVKLCNCVCEADIEADANTPVSLGKVADIKADRRRKCSKKGTKAKGDRGERELVKWLGRRHRSWVLQGFGFLCLGG
jgi:hypothetical protein